MLVKSASGRHKKLGASATSPVPPTARLSQEARRIRGHGERKHAALYLTQLSLDSTTVLITTGAFKLHRGSPQSYSSIRSALTEHLFGGH